MSYKDLNIHLCSPPFAGHLFPLLELGRYLKAQGFKNISILSTARAQEAISLSGLTGITLLAGHEEKIMELADPPYQVKNNPFYLLKQFEGNLSLMATLRSELQSLWKTDKPDLVIGDSILPVAGLLAQELGIAWWTSLATPCALETQKGIPSYLGGWADDSTKLLQLRNTIGRKVIRKFKQGVGWYYRKQLRALNISKLYRENGEEIIYSPEKIFALGLEEFEFKRDWPAALEFIGPITASPPFEHKVPNFNKDRKHVLVSLGTHLPWAKEKAVVFINDVAKAMPETEFHFSLGKTKDKAEQQFDSSSQELKSNLKVFEYLPYDLYLDNYDAAIIHGGTGITYSCIKAGVPMLVWPHDYDQFDHKARIVQAGIGLGLEPQPSFVTNALNTLFSSQAIKQNLKDFKATAASHTPCKTVFEYIKQLEPKKR